MLCPRRAGDDGRSRLRPYTPRSSAPRAGGASVSPRVAGGLGWVTLVWGTGWLAIKISLESFAPLFLAGSRHVGAAAILLLLARAAGATLPRGRSEWTTLLGTGALMAGVCPGLVFWG